MRSALSWARSWASRDHRPRWLSRSSRRSTASEGVPKARGWRLSRSTHCRLQTAVLLHQVAVYDRVFDEMLKWQGQPYWIAKRRAWSGLKRN